MTPLFSMTRTGAARTAAATVFSLLAAGAGAQGVAGNGNGTPPGATTTSERENPATVPGGHACLWETPQPFNQAFIDFVAATADAVN